jgi:3-hydroxyacyl-[acyl-carrier-protein] dehydratase
LRAIDDLSVAESAGRWTITAHRRIDDDDPQLQAHYPRFRIFPGVFVLEALRQAVARAFDTPAMAIVAVRSIRFLAPLLPGDLLTLQAIVEPTPASDVLRVDAEARRNDQEIVARLKIDCAPVDDTAASVPMLALGRLPHGHPMRLIDRIVSLQPGHSITAIKAITCTELCFRALGPDLPASRYAYPASLLLESFGQAAALLWMEAGDAARPDDVVVLVGARNCRIEGAAYPGDVLTHVARLDYARDGHAIVAGETCVGDRRVATVESMVASMRAPSVLAQRVPAR